MDQLGTVFLAAQEYAHVAGGPETALGLDGLFDLRRNVVEHGVEVHRLADPGEAGLADA
jgi:hypothetical protein